MTDIVTEIVASPELRAFLKNWRAEHGYTQRRLGANVKGVWKRPKLSLGGTWVSKIERGIPVPDKMLARVMAVVAEITAFKERHKGCTAATPCPVHGDE